MVNWTEATATLHKYLRLRTMPLAYKLLDKAAELEGYGRLRRPTWKGTMCQIVTVARTYGWSVGVTLDDLSFPNCGAVTGLCEMPEKALDGTMFHEVWFKTQEDGRKHMAAMPRIPAKFEALVVAPLEKGTVEPDIILVFGTPAQMIRLIAGVQWENYERLEFFCMGETACADSIAQCYLSQKPSLAIPCFGERRFGGVMEDELVMALPPQDIPKILEGLRATNEAGIRYPIPPYGSAVSPAAGMPQKYAPIAEEFWRQRELKKGE
ncbi:MAG: DUF169 domain-containing protein [Bacillota bacterium]